MSATDVSNARELFDANARTYDHVNRLVSLGLDARWRGWAAARALVGPHARALDAFAGTGEVGLRVAKLGGEVTLADASSEMLAVARDRAKERGLAVSTVLTDLAADPLNVEGAPFDSVTAMWGLRYVDDPVRAIANLAAQLGDGGRLVLVEFVEPGRGMISRLASLYFFRILPRVASAIVGQGGLYAELVASTHRMGPAERLMGAVRDAGLSIVESKAMGFGLVLGIVATLPGQMGPA